MLAPEIAEEIEKMLKENLKIYIESNGSHLKCELYLKGQCISSDSTRIIIKGV